jgi:hypothetical protein
MWRKLAWQRPVSGEFTLLDALAWLLVFILVLVAFAR